MNPVIKYCLSFVQVPISYVGTRGHNIEGYNLVSAL